MSMNVSELMTRDPQCVLGKTPVPEVAAMMRRTNLGALPVCNKDDNLIGMITDRDIVVQAVGNGRDLESSTAKDLVHGKLVTVESDDSLGAAVETMIQHKVRRVPVIQRGKLVGVLSQADIARGADPSLVVRLLEGVSEVH